MSATQPARRSTKPNVVVDDAEVRPGDARFQALADACEAGVVVHDRGVVIAANASFTELCGYSVEELCGMQMGALVTAESRDMLYEASRADREEPYELTMLRKDGSTSRIEVRSRSFVEAGRALRVATITDVQRRTLDGLGEAADAVDDQLKQQQRLESIGMLAASVAHEINTPITGIINYAELIRRRIGAIDDVLVELGDVGDRLLDAASQIEREASRVGEMVRDLLSFARREQQRSRLVRVMDVVQGTLALLRVVVSNDQIEIDIDIPADLPPLRCQPQQIQQVLLNLVTNARDALNLRFPRYDERKRIRVLARELDEDRERWVRLTVEDQGVGIDADKIARIFTPFFTTKGKQQGTGLGLALSRAIIAEHHGRLDVESELGVYTRFFIDLPVSDPLVPMPSMETRLR